MNIYVKNPGTAGKLVTIPSLSLDRIQELVGGYYTHYPVQIDPQGKVLCLVNEEGLIKRMAPNIYDIVGPAVFVGSKGAKYRGLNPTEVPLVEQFVRDGKKARR